MKMQLSGANLSKTLSKNEQGHPVPRTERNVSKPITNSSSYHELPAQATAEFAPGIMNQPTIDSY